MSRLLPVLLFKMVIAVSNSFDNFLPNASVVLGFRCSKDLHGKSRVSFLAELKNLAR